MAIVILTTILGLLIALIGIEMVNSPPTKKWHKWFWRACFMAIGLGVVTLACMQYRGDEEKSKKTYESFANVISNEAVIRQTVEESKTNIQLTVGFARFDVYLNDSTNPISTGMIISIPTNRVINLVVQNVGEVTAENLTVHFCTTLDTTNINCSGWDMQPPMIKIATRKNISGFQVWRVVSDHSVSVMNIFTPPPIMLSTNIESLNCSVSELKKILTPSGLDNLPDDLIVPFVPLEIEIYSDRSKKQDLFFYLKL